MCKERCASNKKISSSGNTHPTPPPPPIHLILLKESSLCHVSLHTDGFSPGVPFPSASISQEHLSAAADTPWWHQRAADTATGYHTTDGCHFSALALLSHLGIKCYLRRKVVALVPLPKGLLPCCPVAPDREFQQPAGYLHLPFVTSPETLRNEVQCSCIDSCD